MSKHNYTNPAFCQSSEFYPTPNAIQNESYASVEGIYNRSLNGNFIATSGRLAGRTTNGPHRMQRSMSTRSIRTKTSHKTPLIHHQQQQQQQLQRQQYINGNTTQPRTVETFETRSGSGRYALVPVEELATTTTGANSRYAIVPGPPLANAKRFAKSQDELDRYGSRPRLASDNEPHSYHEEFTEQYTSLPPIYNIEKQHPSSSTSSSAAAISSTLTPPKIKHAFSSDFGSKSFLIVDKNSNQRYQMVPTAEDEEIVDDNQEIIQMHNGRPHRYAVIPTEDDCVDDDEDEELEEETCLSTSDLHRSQNYLTRNYSIGERTPLRTSTPQKGVSLGNLAPSSYPGTPLKNPNPAATKMLHELLSTPRKQTPSMRAVQTTPRRIVARGERMQGTNYQLQQRQQRYERQSHHQSEQHINFNPIERKKELSPQRLHYETVKPMTAPAAAAASSVHVNASLTQPDRTMAVITPRVASGSGKVHHPHTIVEEEDCSSLHGKSSFNNSSYTQKVANATITLAIVSLMLVLGSVMNSGLIIYMIMHFGKSFYLQFSLGAAFCGVGLGVLGFRARHCEWLPNRSYTSGYILVTVFCLLKCCGLLVILVFDPYPGLPLHDVTTGIILGLSTFSLFFIGLGVIGSLWCYRPPPDNRVNVV